MEESREWLRVILLAWREVADSVKAGAATWDQRWRASDGTYFPLARRLTFPAQSEQLVDDDSGVLRALLEWMRLVRAPHIQSERRRSRLWHQLHEARRQRTLRLWPACGAHGERVDHHHTEEDALMSRLHVTSGAATVLAKRRRTEARARTTGGAPAAASASSSSMPSGTGCGAAASSTAVEPEANGAASAAVASDRDDELPQSRAGSNVKATAVGSYSSQTCNPCCEFSGNMRNVPSNAAGARTQPEPDMRRRWTETLLVFSESARERLEGRVGGWHWVKPAEGDG